MVGADRDNTCGSCGRTISPDKALCNACAGTASSTRAAAGASSTRAAAAASSTRAAPAAPPLSEGDRKRAAWARAGEERDAAWRGDRDARVKPGFENPFALGRPRPRRLGWYLALGGAVLACVIGGVAVTLGGDEPSPPVAATPTPRAAPTRPPPPEPPAIRIAKATSFADAIAIARPALADTPDELGAGARLLAIYAASRLRWAEVDVPVDTTIGKVEKDPALERGKRLCATGELLRIERRDVQGRRVYVGQLRTAEADVVAFVAVGTTGELVKRSTGTLCGAVLGMSGRAVSVLGMFDLAENRLPLVEQ